MFFRSDPLSRMRAAIRLTVLATSGSFSNAINNGLGITPPRGWRSWNQFGTNINQDLVEDQYAAMVHRGRQVDGVPTSLLDLGYRTAGIDDGWQKCHSGPGGVGFHNASGYPIVDTAKFENMKAMTTKAKSLGLMPGWYGNNCACNEQRPECAFKNGTDICFAGDVAATIDFGFESIKLDGCGIQNNMTHYAYLYNRSGEAILLENCHNRYPNYPELDPRTGKIDCPMNLFRSSQDIRPQFGSVLSNLMSTTMYNSGLSGPGCWAYPDMLQVGTSVMSDFGLNNLSLTEARTHFAAWCIVSSPLILGNDLTDDKTMDEIWPIISNREALAVNAAWAGDAGGLVKQSKEMVRFPNCHWGHERYCNHAATMVWKKKVGDNKVALLLMNNRNVTSDVHVSWLADLPRDTVSCSAAGCDIRDVHTQEDLGSFAEGFTAKDLLPHDSAFIVVTSTRSLSH